MSEQSNVILIVEDNALNMKLFSDLLKAHNYTVVPATDGLDVLPLAREHKPDLIIMDIQLPEVSGLEVIQWLKNDHELKDIPIIAITAFAMKGDEERIRSKGCDDYISKPIAIKEFYAVIEKYLPRTLHPTSGK